MACAKSRRMRKNFAALFTLLVICSLLARRSQPHQWEDSWREELLFASTEPFPHRALQVDEDRYLYLERGRGDWNRVDQGVIQLGPQGQLVFISNARSFKTAQFNGRQLSGDWGRFTLERQSVPRLKPDSTWITSGEVFSIGRIHVGMSHRRVRDIYPEEYTTAHDRTQFLYGDFRHRLVEVRYTGKDVVARVSGDCLEQGGRPLFNKRTRRSDIEKTFPGERWRVESGHEISQRIPGGSLSLGTGRLMDEVQPGFHCVLDRAGAEAE